VKVEMVNNTRL